MIHQTTQTFSANAALDQLTALCRFKTGDRVFFVKLINHELLSILLTEDELRNLLQEAKNIITNTLNQAGCIQNNILSFNCYIIFIIQENNLLSPARLAYLVYRDLAMHYSITSRDIGLECKMSSVKLLDNIDYHQLIEKSLCQLAASSDKSYYLEFNDRAIEDIESDVEKISILKQSLKEHNCSFAYQPIIERTTGLIPYYECLLRIPNQSSEPISMGPLIELAERNGLNNIIDQTALAMAVNELKAAPNISLAVNISNAGILDANLLNLALELLTDKSVAQRLVLEITETSLNCDFDKTGKFIDIMRNLGCRIAMDDFGAGFTSFKQLQNLRVDIIKIDGSFIRDLVYNERNQYLVVALIDMANQLDVKTVAEFVENGEIAKFLLDVEIDYMQGNFFSPALNYRSWDKS